MLTAKINAPTGPAHQALPKDEGAQYAADISRLFSRPICRIPVGRAAVRPLISEAVLDRTL
jgi:hypothetical protein